MAKTSHLTQAEARGVRHARELEDQLTWLDTFSGTALGVLAVASGIYTYLGALLHKWVDGIHCMNPA